MEDSNQPENIVPPNVKGKASNAEVSVKLTTSENARRVFTNAKNMLCDINKWRTYSRVKLATTCLLDGNGNVVNRLPQKGDFIRTDLVGPGSIEGDGYDWIQIIAVEESSDPRRDMEMFAFVVKPSHNPLSTDKNETAHFFTNDSTNSFIVKRERNIVTGSVNGRNELPNVRTKNKIDKVRNAAVSAASALGFSPIQWKLLLNGILKRAVKDASE